MRDIHLRKSLWFDETATGTLRMKRVSAAADAHFPREWRKVFQQVGAVGMTKLIMSERKCQLNEAWTEVKRMFNDKPGVAK